MMYPPLETTIRTTSDVFPKEDPSDDQVSILKVINVYRERDWEEKGTKRFALSSVLSKASYHQSS